MNQINIPWSFSLIEASVSVIFAIKNCYFLPLIFVERSRNCRQKQLVTSMLVPGGKKREIQNSVFESAWRRNYGVLCGHKLHQPAEKMCSKSKVSTFKFPADPKTREEWLKTFQPTKHSRLCENHFTGESFDESYVIKLSLGLTPGKPQLRKNAIPTIFNFTNVGRDKKRRATGQNESELSAFAKRRKLEVTQGFVSLLMLIGVRAIFGQKGGG